MGLKKVVRKKPNKNREHQPETENFDEDTGIGELPEELENALQDISDENREKILQAFLGFSIQKLSAFSGPLPPPSILKEYSEIVENGAERIFQLTEKQSKHRMQLEDHAIREELEQSRRGQNFGFLLGLVGLVLATILALLGQEVVAGIFGTTTIVGLVTVFVVGKRAQNKDEDY